ncbi:MAG: hypothetical protein HZB85_06465 [Deltaproteobacteria bacterium]|nr:hypothetical protein [Deltaproteobacteria bacterium]
MSLESNNISGARKAAVILAILGEDLAAQVVRHLAPDEMGLVGAALVRTQTVPSDVAARLAGEFVAAVGRLGEGGGGVEFARGVLTRAVGAAGAGGVMDRLEAIDVITRAPIDTLVEALKGEHPQAIAVVISQLDAPRASIVLEALDPGLRQDIRSRVANISNPSTAALCDIAALINKTEKGG